MEGRESQEETYGDQQFNEEQDDDGHNAEYVSGGTDQEEDCIEVEQEMLEALVLQFERVRDGLDPGPPIRDEHGNEIRLSAAEYEQAIEQL